MKTVLRSVNDHGKIYNCLAFVCPGCLELETGFGTGLHMLPVNTEIKTPAWDWDGDLLHPTMAPSILTHYNNDVCHSFLIGGIFKYLPDSTHSLSGKEAPMLDLPDWFIREENETEESETTM